MFKIARNFYDFGLESIQSREVLEMVKTNSVQSAECFFLIH